MMSNRFLLSESEIEILRFVHEFGYCEINQIIKRFEMKKSNAYGCMKRLIERAWIANTRIMKYQPRAYYVTLKGIDLLKLDLPVIKRIALNNYEHQLAVIHVHIKLRNIYPEAIWISERRLLREQNNHNQHLPDGALIFPDGKQCAIEVEKTPKAKNRLEDIMLKYGLQCTYKEVWYFCAASVLPAVSRFAANLPYIKVFKLAEFV